MNYLLKDEKTICELNFVAVDRPLLWSRHNWEALIGLQVPGTHADGVNLKLKKIIKFCWSPVKYFARLH